MDCKVIWDKEYELLNALNNKGRKGNGKQQAYQCKDESINEIGLEMN